MAITVGDIVRVAFRQTLGVDDIVNVMHFECVTVPGLGGDALAVDDLSEIAGDLWVPFASRVSGNQGAVDINVYNVTDDAPAGVGSFGAYGGGTAAGEDLPAPVAMLALFPTNVKRKVGRIYLGCLTEASQANGLWVSGAIADGEAFCDFLMTTLGGSNGYEFEYGIWSRSGGIFTRPTTRRIQPVPAYQLRRKPGRGS